jgi:DNA-directed RNA polymerase alpha subunit
MSKGPRVRKPSITMFARAMQDSMDDNDYEWWTGEAETFFDELIPRFVKELQDEIRDLPEAKTERAREIRRREILGSAAALANAAMAAANACGALPREPRKPKPRRHIDELEFTVRTHNVVTYRMGLTYVDQLLAHDDRGLEELVRQGGGNDRVVKEVLTEVGKIRKGKRP